MNLVEWIFQIFGVPSDSSTIWVFYVIAAIVLLIFIDIIFSFIIGAISSLFYGGKR